MKPNGEKILIADDEIGLRDSLRDLLEVEGYSVTATSNGIEAINKLQTEQFDIALLDIRMPKIDGFEVLRYVQQNCPFTQPIMLTGLIDVKLAVEAIRLGAYDYITKPYSSDDLLKVIIRALERKNLLMQNEVMKSELQRLSGSSEIIGDAPSFKKILRLAAKIAPTESSVMIYGHSGTGKELIANFIYKNSLRAEKPFVALNCASIPDSLIESELFGHEKGAFTDAIRQKQGLVEIANGGTLFLDEIGDISLAIQPKLLRFIQEGEYRRVGGNTVLHSDVRIISATNKRLEKEVADGKFREDLLYRLNVITIDLPPLKERKEDIPKLAQWFIQKKMKTRIQKTLSSDSIDVLIRYEWPGNVRELENVIERAAILSQGEIIEAKDLALPVRSISMKDGQGDGQSHLGKLVPMKEVEREHYMGVLNTLSWNKSQAAKVLGVSLKTLYTKIQQYQLKEKSY
jgi:two-component system, NtrC family, response regulator AtoC